MTEREELIEALAMTEREELIEALAIKVKHLTFMRAGGSMNTRYSDTRVTGAQYTAATKLTQAEHEALHCLAVERHISDYEFVRRALQRAIAVPDKSLD